MVFSMNGLKKTIQCARIFHRCQQKYNSCSCWMWCLNTHVHMFTVNVSIKLDHVARCRNVCCELSRSRAVPTIIGWQK